jgi:hypothetical protein
MQLFMTRENTTSQPGGSASCYTVVARFGVVVQELVLECSSSIDREEVKGLLQRIGAASARAARQ